MIAAIVVLIVLHGLQWFYLISLIDGLKKGYDEYWGLQNTINQDIVAALLGKEDKK